MQFNDQDDDRVPVTRQVRFGQARLVPDIDGPRAWLLAVDGTPQSYVDLDDPAHLEFDYVRRLAHIVDTAAAPGRPLAVTHLGAGALTLARYTAATRPGSAQHVVDADDLLLDLVREHLPLPGESGIDIHAADARTHLEQRAAPPAQLVVADLFTGGRTPARVASLEFTRLAARALRPGPYARYAVNITDGPPFGFARAQAAALVKTFPYALVIAERDVLDPGRFGNIVMLAGFGPLPEAGLALALARDPYPAVTVDARAFARGAAPMTDANAWPSPQPPTADWFDDSADDSSTD